MTETYTGGSVKISCPLDGHTYAVPLLGKLNEGRWYSKSPPLTAIFGVGFGRIYQTLDRLERSGLLRSEWSCTEYPAERGWRRRRYYAIQTAKGEG